MTAGSRRFRTAIIVLAILQTLVLGWIIVSRIALLRSSDVVTLSTQPVDPHDLFRGDYVTLSYGISRLPLDGLKGDKDFGEGQPIYVEIAPAGATWKAVAVSHDYPAPAAGDKVIRGRIRHIARNVPRVRALPGSRTMEEVPCDDCVMASVEYGIESYFVAEGTGRGYETARNERRLAVDVALSGDGEAAIKALRLDGEVLYEEPLL